MANTSLILRFIDNTLINSNKGPKQGALVRNIKIERHPVRRVREIISMMKQRNSTRGYEL